MIAAFSPGVNDTVTTILAILVASVVRIVWGLQQRVSRLEGLDEHRERVLDLDRAPEADEVDE